MSVLLTFVAGMLHERTRRWAVDHTVAPWELRAGDEAGYWRAVAAAWTFRHDDTVIVEQDIVPADGVVDRMRACPRPWCASPYPIANGYLLDEGLGCTKFAARLKRRHPDLMQRVGEIDDDGMPARDWHRLDTRIARVLRQLGYRPHRHARSEHLHDYQRRP